MDQQINDVKKIEVDFREKELKLLGKFEDKLDNVLSNQTLILSKLNEISGEMK